MTRQFGQYDVVIVGAGTAGAAAAGFLAERGMRVLCVDRRPLAEAGARWVNGVPARAFAVAGLPLPTGEEHRGGNDEFHLVAGRGPRRIVLATCDVLEVDMRLLVERLHDRARRLGATLMGETRVLGIRDTVLETDRGAVRASWFVDASGLRGARLLDQPPVPAEHLCAAAQEVRRVADEQAARAFFARHKTPFGRVLAFAGLFGGFSVLNVRASPRHVSILTGTIPGLGHPSGRAVLDEFAAAEPWVGEVMFGGARAVPLRRPRDRLAHGRIALLGDAGCQVFPAHGSGIGPGLVAARVLADALASGAGVHGYAVTWQRRHGGVFASYDLFRRLSQTLSVADFEAMMASGLIDERMARSGMDQEMPRLGVGDLAGKLAALGRTRQLAGRMARLAAVLAAVRVLYARYPADPAHLPAWSRAVARLFGEPPDIA